MVARRPKAPSGCYWRGDTLWGRVRKDHRDLRWSLETDDPKVAAERYKAGKSQLIAVRNGDAKLAFHNVVEDWGTHWLQRNKSAKTIKRYLCSIDQLARFLEGKVLLEIDGQLVADIIRARGKQGVANATIKRDLVAVSSVMNYAIGQGWLEVNPVLPRMKLLEERRDPIVLPVKDDVELVIKRSPGMIADLIRVAIATGAREEELITARRQHVDHMRKQLTITGKRNKRRVIDLEPFGGDHLIGALPTSRLAAPVLAFGWRELQELRQSVLGNRSPDGAMGQDERGRLPAIPLPRSSALACGELAEGRPVDLCATAAPRARQHQDNGALLRIPHTRRGHDRQGTERAQKWPHEAKRSWTRSSRKPYVAVVWRGGRVAEGGGLLNRYTV